MASNQPLVKRAWWKEASVYQIYPASFMDSNGDGLGDLPGIYSKLDYIQNLGVDIIWVCPIYKSPQVDMGYDISDYKSIHPPFGTIEDVEKIIKGCHDRGMKFVMDLVVNHTSDQHKWFEEAKKSKDSEYRDYYIWKKPKYDSDGKPQPPNNWGAIWGGSAWEYDEASNEYYLHLFAPEQPDLNWENPKVRAAVEDIMRFWLDKGVDGFRCDVINFISKVPGLPDAPITRPGEKYQPGDKYYACGPRLHEYLQAIGKILKEYNAFSVGEMPCVDDPKEILKAVGFDRGELNMIFHFEIVSMDEGPLGKFSPRNWTLQELKTIVSKWQNFMIANDGWNALYLENHDQSRTVSRYANDTPEWREMAAKMFATFLVLQSGTVFVYQGQELGMINIEKERPVEEYKDLETLNAWREVLERYPDDKIFQQTVREEIQKKSRDNARTPMQWDSSPSAGFTTSPHPWQALNTSYPHLNASLQTSSPTSPYNYWRSLLSLRKSHKDIFIYGDFALIDVDHEKIFAYLRTYGGEKVLVVANFSEEMVVWDVPGGLGGMSDGVGKGGIEDGRETKVGEVLVSNYGGIKERDGRMEVRGYEAFACFVR